MQEAHHLESSMLSVCLRAGAESAMGGESASLGQTLGTVDLKSGGPWTEGDLRTSRSGVRQEGQRV